MPVEPIPPADLGLPRTTGPIRFAVGSPDGLSSNSWRFWTTAAGDAYLICRDNFQNMKVSLHVEGGWRMAFTKEALKEDPTLVPAGGDRAWEVWDEPPPILPDVVAAFRLYFPTSELAVRPEQRTTKLWRDNTLFIDAAPAGSGKLTVVTLFVTLGDPELSHGSEPSFRLASLELVDGRRAQLVAHFDPESDLPEWISASRAAVLAQMERAGVEIADEGYLYFFRRQPDGARCIVGARARSSQ